MGSIADNDAPTVSISDGTPNPATEAEGASISFTVTLSNPADRTMTVEYTTVNGTATAGSDYTTTTGTITFLAGETTGTITVPVLDDNIFEDSEAFTVELGATTGGVTVLDGEGVGSIADNDQPAVQSVRVSEEGLIGANPDGAPSGADSGDDLTASGTFVVSGVSNPNVTLVAPNPDTYTYKSGGVTIIWALSDDNHTLTGSANGTPIVVVSITAAGAYTVTLSGPIDHEKPTIAGTSVETRLT